MAFTDIEIAKHMNVLEDSSWSRRHRSLHLRDQVREGQRFSDRAIGLFIMRPAFNRPGEHTEISMAKVQDVRGQDVWPLGPDPICAGHPIRTMPEVVLALAVGHGAVLPPINGAKR